MTFRQPPGTPIGAGIAWRLAAVLIALVVAGVGVMRALTQDHRGGHGVEAWLDAVQVEGGIELHWNADATSHKSTELWRWSEGESPQRIAVPSRNHYLDRSAKPNHFYMYGVFQGARSIATASGVRSDIDRAFDCRQMRPVPEALLGVDRQENFVNAKGERVTITVAAPRPKVLIREVSPCGGREACSDLEGINEAIAEVAKAGGGRVQLAAGRYLLNAPTGIRRYAHVYIRGARDLIIAGAGQQNGHPLTELVFDELPSVEEPARVVHGIAVRASTRMLFKDLALDWRRSLAIPGRIEMAGANEQHFVLEDGAYDVPDVAQPPELSNINLYNHEGRTFAFVPRSRLGFAAGTLRFNPNFAADGRYYYIVPGRFFPPGAGAVSLLRSGHAVSVAEESSDITFEGVHIYAGASGFSFGPNGGRYRISNSRITRKPNALLRPGERPRFVSIRGDSSARNTEGELIVEASEFGFIDDDAFNVTGGLVQGTAGTAVVSDLELIFRFKGYDPFPHEWRPGDTLALFDPTTLRRITSIDLGVAQRTREVNVAEADYTYRFKFASSVPELGTYRGRSLSELPYLAEPQYASGGAIFRGNCFHDSAGGRLVISTANALIEGNVFGNMGGTAIELSANPLAWREGPGASGVVVRGNRISGAGYWFDDVDHTGAKNARVTGWLAGAAIIVAALAADGFYPKGAPNNNIEIVGNFVANTRGVGIVIASASNVVVRDNIVVNANSRPFDADFDRDFCGARSKGFVSNGANQPWCLARTAARGGIMVTQAHNVHVSRNVMLGTSEPVFVDPRSVD